MDERNCRIALVDQQRAFLDAIGYRLSGEPALAVACTAEKAEEGLAAIVVARPDVALVDSELPLGAAFDLVAEVRRALPTIRVLLLLPRPDDKGIDQGLRAGADGLLSRTDSLADLVEGIRQAGQGRFALSPSVSARLEFDAGRGEYRLKCEPPLKALTDRQLEILRHLARGESVKTVARKLFLSPKSVDNQKFRIMHKIGVRDKVSLALFAIREGLIQP